jgi:hypothetical protein
MPFPPDVVENLLVKSARHCCICHKRKGTKIVIHHIEQESDGGGNDEDNGIPICSDCHGDMGYNDRHPSGRKFHPSELRRRRDDWFEYVAQHPVIPDDPMPAVPSLIGDGNTIGNGNIIGHIVQVQPRVVNKTEVQRTPDDITDAMALEVRKAVIKLWNSCPKTGQYVTPRGWYNQLYDQFGVTSYKTLKMHQLADVMTWIKQQAAIQRPRLRRTNNPAWRKSLYAAIHARAGELGIDKTLHAFATERLGIPVTSLKDLGERDLKRLHSIIFSIPRN